MYVDEIVDFFNYPPRTVPLALAHRAPRLFGCASDRAQGLPQRARRAIASIAPLLKQTLPAAENRLITSLTYPAISLHCSGLPQHNHHLRLTDGLAIDTYYPHTGPITQNFQGIRASYFGQRY